MTTENSGQPINPRTRTSPRDEQRPSLRDEQKAFTRSRLIDAAITVFEAKGFSSATVDDITNQARASRATFYVHFKNKEEVAYALFAEMKPEGKAAYGELDLAILSRRRSDVRAWVQQAFEWWENNRGAVLALEQVVASGGFGHGGLDHVQAEAMTELMHRWGDDKRDEARLRIYLLGTLITRTYRAWRIDGLFSELNPDQIIDTLADLWITGLHLPRLYPDGDWHLAPDPGCAAEDSSPFASSLQPSFSESARD
jgi:AcrR family transcriptional regulator